MTAATDDCESRPTSRLSSRPQYLVNLAILQSCYDLTNETFSGDKLYYGDTLPSFEALKLPLLNSNISRILAADTEASYALNKLVNSFQNESVILHSASEAVLMDYIEGQIAPSPFWLINMQDWQTWLLLIVVLTCVSFAYLHYRLTQRVALLQHVIGAKTALSGLVLAQHVASGNSLEIGLKSTSPNTIALTAYNGTDSFDFITGMIAEVRRVDIVLIIITLTCALIIVGIFTVALKRALWMHSYVYLEIKSGSSVIFIPIWTFPDPTRYYRVAIPTSGFQLSVANYGIFAILSLNTNNWFAWHTLSHTRIELPQRVLLNPFSVRAVKQILLSRDYTVCPIVIHNCEFSILPPV